MHEEVLEGGVAFYLGCVKITPPEILARNPRNLVVHASDLPNDKGFSPWTYAVLRGDQEITICLIEAAEQVDAGNIIYKDTIALKGTELVAELRALIGEKTVELCERFLSEKELPAGAPQRGAGNVLKRRYLRDSRIDPARSIAEQFDLFRVVDNEKYPAFFEYRGRRYKLTIEPHEKENPDDHI